MCRLTIRDIEEDLAQNGVLYFKRCSPVTLYLKKREINEYLTLTKKNWRVVANELDGSLVKVVGDGSISDAMLIRLNEVLSKGSYILKTTTDRNLRRVVKELNEYLEKNNIDKRIVANYKTNSIEVKEDESESNREYPTTSLIVWIKEKEKSCRRK